MLVKRKSISLTGESKISGKTVATFSASVYDGDDGNNNMNSYVQDQDAYNTNRREVRKDLQEFQDWVWNTQDQLINEETQANVEKN